MSALSEARDLLFGLVLEDGRRWGAAAAEFQVRDAEAVLSETGPRFHFIDRPRGGSKTTDEAGVAAVLLGKVAPRNARLYAVAGDREQAGLLLDAVRGFVDRTPSLAALLEVGVSRVTARHTGATLDLLSADASTAYGLRPWMVLADELSAWPATENSERLWEAISTALGKVKGARAVIITNAGAPASLAGRVREHAERSELWSVHSTPGPLPWIDARFLEDERARLPESSFRRLHLNEWVESEDSLAALDDIKACAVLDGPLPPRDGTRYVVGVDLGFFHDATVGVVAHAEPIHAAPESPTVNAHRIVVDRMQVWQGSKRTPVDLQEVEDWIAFASTTFGGARVVGDWWQFAGTEQRLTARGVQATALHLTQPVVGRLGSLLHVLIRNRTLAIPNDDALIDELAHVKLREVPGGLRLDHLPGRHDDRAMAVAIAADALLSEPAPGKARSVSSIPKSGPPVIRRAGLVLRGRQYLDVDTGPAPPPPPGGVSSVNARPGRRDVRRVPPPGWRLDP